MTAGKFLIVALTVLSFKCSPLPAGNQPETCAGKIYSEELSVSITCKLTESTLELCCSFFGLNSKSEIKFNANTKNVLY